MLQLLWNVYGPTLKRVCSNLTLDLSKGSKWLVSDCLFFQSLKKYSTFGKVCIDFYSNKIVITQNAFGPLYHFYKYELCYLIILCNFRIKKVRRSDLKNENYFRNIYIMIFKKRFKIRIDSYFYSIKNNNLWN